MSQTKRINKTRIRAIAIVTFLAFSISLGGFLVNVFAKYIAQADNVVKLNVEKPHYVVAFDANGGTGSMANQDFVYDTAQELSLNEFTRADYGFAGWNTKADGTGRPFMDGESVINLAATGTVTLYAQWEEGSLRTVFRHDGACVFHGGESPITGDECTEYASRYYIDTGVRLFDSANANSDFELGFTIVSFDASENGTQATFAQNKYENEGVGYPGFFY